MASIRVVKDHTELQALKTTWHELHQASGSDNVYLTFEWAEAACSHFHLHNNLQIVVAEQDGAAVCIIPLVRKVTLGGTRLQFLGYPWADYGEALLNPSEPEVLVQSINYIDRELKWDLLDLAAVPESSLTWKVLSSDWQRPNWLVSVSNYSVAPYIPIQQSWEEYLAGIRNKLRTDTMRQIRRLEKQGELCFRHCQNQEEAWRVLDKFATQKSTRYVTTGARNILQDGRLLAFYKDITNRFWTEGWVDLTTLTLDDEVIAIHFGFVFAGKYFYYMPSFNMNYADYSVGRILLFHLMEESFQRRLREFDFLSGNDLYKYEWTQKIRQLFSLKAYRRSSRGLVLYGVQEQLIGAARRSDYIRSLVRWKRKLFQR